MAIFRASACQTALNEQSARNPKIVRLINKFPDPPNKDVGDGLNTAFEAMKKLRLRKSCA
jgi:ATP-dependent DNA helicase RecG